MQERRNFARTFVRKRARIYLEDSSEIDCLVLDLTNAGAGIQVANLKDVPEALDLTFDLGRSIRSCRLVWRTLDRMGVEFI
jgi:methyl-accepting chemotaxis protein